MFMKKMEREEYSDMLYEAERSRTQIQPLTSMDGGLNIDDAYYIQLNNIDRAVKAGQVISGKKIGLTSEGMQKQLGVGEPDYGHLFECMDCHDNKVSVDVLIQPKIEAELAFVLKDDLSGENITAEDVVAATDYVVGAFEIVDSRIADWKIKLVDTIADNASSGRYILGTKRISPTSELADITMNLYKNGEFLATGSGAAVLGDPCLAVAWLANRLKDYGVMLKKGEVILSGAFSAAPEATRGDKFTAEFSELGTITAEFI